jgi:hypothetical protein
MKPIENMTVILQEDIHMGFSPRVDRTTLKGSCVLSNLSESCHNVTFYLITDREISLYRTYGKGEVLYSATIQLVIDISESFSAVPVVAASTAAVVIVIAGLLQETQKLMIMKSISTNIHQRYYLVFS